jgi:hypothetical protein
VYFFKKNFLNVYLKKDIKYFFDRGIALKCPAVITPLGKQEHLIRGRVRAFNKNHGKRLKKYGTLCG